jgi:hypothetical protein
VSATTTKRRGRKPVCSRELVEKMYELHCCHGLSYQEIADRLKTEGVPMPLGGLRWMKSAVVRIMDSTYGREIGTELGLLVVDGEVCNG